MLDLNLLSPEKKQIIRQLNNFSIIMNIGISLMIVVLVGTGLLAASNWLLNDNLKSIDASIATIRENNKKQSNVSIDQIITSLNKQLAQAKTIQGSYVQWPVFLQDFSETLPDGISLTLIDTNVDTKSIRINGVADNRQHLLQFQDALGKLTYLSDLIFPLSNLAQQNEIQFEISGKLTDKIYGKD